MIVNNAVKGLVHRKATLPSNFVYYLPTHAQISSVNLY